LPKANLALVSRRLESASLSDCLDNVHLLFFRQNYGPWFHHLTNDSDGAGTILLHHHCHLRIYQIVFTEFLHQTGGNLGGSLSGHFKVPKQWITNHSTRLHTKLPTQLQLVEDRHNDQI
jgi:hypothetical protein